MEPVTTTTINHSTTDKSAARNALAIVGFIALVILGILLAISAARFVPQAVSKIGAATVGLSSIFVPGGADEEAPVVVPPVYEEPAPEAPAATTTTPIEEPSAPSPRPTTPTYVLPPVVRVVPVNTPRQLYGNPDLTVSITSVGYCTSSNVSSFRADNEVPDGERAGVKFSVFNRGTNVTGSWDFEVELPTAADYTYDSARQRSLSPGDRMDFTLCFDELDTGNDRRITVEVDPSDDVNESSEGNNRDSETIDIED